MTIYDIEPYTGAYFTLTYNDMKERTSIGFPEVYSQLQLLNLFLPTTHPVIWNLQSTISGRAELEYGYREINAETPDMWLHNAERLVIQLFDKYEPAFAREADEDFDASSLYDAEAKTTYGRKQDNLVQDTPYGALSDDADYTSGQSHVSQGGSDLVQSAQGTDAERLVRLRDTWETTMSALIKDLGELFIHTVGLDVVL